MISSAGCAFLFGRSGLVSPLAFFLFWFCLSSYEAAAALPPHQEIISHEQVGAFVNFTLSDKPLAISLQGLVVRNGRWVTLVSKKKPHHYHPAVVLIREGGQGMVSCSAHRNVTVREIRHYCFDGAAEGW